MHGDLINSEIHMMKTLKNPITLAAVTLTSLALNGCAPIIIGGGALVGTLATKEKGISGTVSDSAISTKIKAGLYKHESDLFSKVGISVQSGDVLLTGFVPDQQAQMEAEKIAWEVKGVKHVNNNIETAEGGGAISTAKDAWITTQIKSSLIFADEVQSLNYNIKTVNGVVYVMGIAQNEEEITKVNDLASKINGVIKVVSYAHTKDEIID
jgi:osmotically-inducible protein OsmY